MQAPIGAVWLGAGFTAAIPYALLPPAAILVAGRSADLLVGQATAVGSVVVLAVPILAGWLSDRTTSIWGRRTPWLLALAFVTVAGELLSDGFLAGVPLRALALWIVGVGVGSGPPLLRKVKPAWRAIRRSPSRGARRSRTTRKI